MLVQRTRPPSTQTINVLRALAADPGHWHYGNDLATEVRLRSGSLYPILIRLADRGLLDTSWEPGLDSRPPRHLYRLTPTGYTASNRQRLMPEAIPQRTLALLTRGNTRGSNSRHAGLIRVHSFVRRCLDVPIALAALAALAVVWWMRASRAERDGRPPTNGRARTSGRTALALPAIAAIVLLPWTIGIATDLPHTAVARHWNTAWAGLDIAIMIGLALTSWLGYRRDRLVALTATATATLMCTDAWFDLCTCAPGYPFAYAVAEAAAELVVTAVCLVIALAPSRINGASTRR